MPVDAKLYGRQWGPCSSLLFATLLGVTPLMSVILCKGGFATTTGDAALGGHSLRSWWFRGSRSALHRLMEVNSEEVARRKAVCGDGMGPGDTSQRGDWHNFRNLCIDGIPMSIDRKVQARLWP